MERKEKKKGKKGREKGKKGEKKEKRNQIKKKSHFSVIVRWANDSVLQGNVTKMLVNDGEMRLGSFTHITIIEEPFYSTSLK